jgi:hypothetical protein
VNDIWAIVFCPNGVMNLVGYVKSRHRNLDVHEYDVTSQMEWGFGEPKFQRRPRIAPLCAAAATTLAGSDR